MKKSILVLGMTLFSTLMPSLSQAQQIVELYRAYKNGDHLYTTNKDEITRARYTLEAGSGFYLFMERTDRMQHLMRCVVRGTGKHFLSSDTNCEGQQVEGPLGYVSSVAQPGLVPIVRFYNPRAGHISVIDQEKETLEGWNAEMVQGYAIPMTSSTLEQNESASLPAVNCTLVSLSIKGKPGSTFSGAGMSESAAIDSAIQTCVRTLNPWSMCLPTLGATTSCQRAN